MTEPPQLLGSSFPFSFPDPVIPVNTPSPLVMSIAPFRVITVGFWQVVPAKLKSTVPLWAKLNGGMATPLKEVEQHSLVPCLLFVQASGSMLPLPVMDAVFPLRSLINPVKSKLQLFVPHGSGGLIRMLPVAATC